MVWTESAGSTKWQATVDRIDRIADTNSGTYGVRLSINNPDQLIPVGLRCRVHFLPETVAAGPLRADGVDVRVLKRSGQKMVGFKIVSPPQYSGADLKAYLNRLRNAGMNDFIPLSKKQGAPAHCSRRVPQSSSGGRAGEGTRGKGFRSRDRALVQAEGNALATGKAGYPATGSPGCAQACKRRR